MRQQLFLDSARIGQFSKVARSTYREFIDLVSDCPTAPWISEFIRSGVGAFSSTNVESRSRLASWQGLRDFESQMALQFGASVASKVYFASRSRSLLRFGFNLLFKNCRKCMTVDTCWPAYMRELAIKGRASKQGVFVKRIYKNIYVKKQSTSEVIDQFCQMYLNLQCDGLFLPVVDHFGTLIPVAEIIHRLRSHGAEIRFVLLDASQALGHVPMDAVIDIADILIAGTQKWLGSYFPLGVALASKSSSRQAIEFAMKIAVLQQTIDDGLLSYTLQVDEDLAIPTETVNLAPLFSAFGSIQESDPTSDHELARRTENTNLVCDIAQHRGWKPMRPANEMRSGVVLLQPPSANTGMDESALLQKLLDEQKIVATVLENGLIRMSMPVDPISNESIHQLEAFFDSFTIAKSPQLIGA